MAQKYGPHLRSSLEALGFDLETALIGSSALHRAKETAELLFPERGDHLVTIPHFTENGKIPENTPRGGLKEKANWGDVVHWMGDTSAGNMERRLINSEGVGPRQIIVVGHGSYLRTQVLQDPKAPMRNLDAYVIDGTLMKHSGKWKLHIGGIGYIPYNGVVSPESTDKCVLSSDLKKIASYTKKMSRRKTQKRQKQRGGGVGLPLAYFQPGAQMHGTSGSETGVGVGASTNTWARLPIHQSAGSRKQKQKQDGGFSPSVMGAFGTHAASLIPLAGYMGYKMMSRKGRKTKKSRKGKGRK
jgi:hypothetical protein